MAEEPEKSVLRRMASIRGDAPGLTEMTPARALRNAIAKAGDEVLETAVAVRDTTESTIIPDDLADDLPETALYLQLEGPDGAAGVAVACPQIIGAVIEAKMIGQILNGTAAERRPTRTDAMLVGEFLDCALLGFGMLTLGCAAPPPVDGYGCGPALPDVRAAQMVLTDAAHLRFKVEIDFAKGAKSGFLYLLFPVDRAPGLTGAGSAPNWHATLENSVLGTTARLEAVLGHIKLPLADLSALKVGDELPLTGASLDNVSLVGPNRVSVTKARLGRSGPVRAVRVCLNGASRPARMTQPPASTVDAVAMPVPKADAPGPMADPVSAGSGGASSGALPETDPPGLDTAEVHLPALEMAGGMD